MSDMSSAEAHKYQPKIEQPLGIEDCLKAADSTTISRLKNLVPERMRLALRQSASKVALTGAALSYLISSGCGNKEGAEVPYIEPTPSSPPAAVRELPGGIPSEVEFERLTTPTREPTLAPSPTPTLEPASTNTPSPTETPTPPLSPTQEVAERKELIPYSSSITIVDAAPSVPTKGLIQKEFIPNDEMIRKMLADKYVSKDQIIQEFGQNYEEKWDEVVERYPQALVYRFADTYFNHGENVASVAEDTLERSGLESTGINILPLQKIFDKDSGVTFIKDASGNPGVSLNFDQKRIIELLKNDPNRVINGSFQVGNVELFQKTKKDTEVIPKYDRNDPRFSESGYFLDDGEIFYQGAVESKQNSDGSVDYLNVEGKKVDPISWEEFKRRKLENSEVKEYKSTSLSIVGAYTKEKAMENLPKLFEICNAYPNKFFVFAAGNSGEDFREAMEALKDNTPKNLLMVGEWIKYKHVYGVYEGPAMEYGKYGEVLGPDIYVYNEGSNHPHGSSFSTPEISAEIEILLNNGLSIDQAKAKILASSDIHSLQLEDGTKYTARVFNPSKIQ